jgi:hypothetical protein
MAHSYKSEYPPGVQVDDGIKAFFEEFYEISDTPDAHDRYADSFTGDATLVVASKKGVGRKGSDLNYFLLNLLKYHPIPSLIFVLEILQIRKGMWAAVASRLHTPIKIFPYGSGSNEVMLYGTVAYKLKDEKQANVSTCLPR